MRSVCLAPLLLIATLATPLCSPAADPVGVVSHVKVLSNHVEDVSSLAAWKNWAIKPGMTDEQKALAIWETVVKFQHQDSPPLEFLHNENTVLDPIKLFNVYGYSFCSVASANVQSLARYAGLEARGYSINAHSVAEVKFADRWRLLDASLINYFRQPDGQIASVEEIAAAVKEWYKDNPGLKGNNKALSDFQKANGWTGWKRGPKLLVDAPCYDAGGWLPAGTHGWYSTMQEYDGKVLNIYESGYSQGYQVNIQLRPGMRLVRNWSNKGLHVNMPKGEAPGCIKGTVGKDTLRYTPKYGDLAPGRVGNGTLEYDVLGGKGPIEARVLALKDVEVRASDFGRAAFVKQGATTGTIELRMPSSYVYLSGALELVAAVPDGGKVKVELSDNNGLDWKEVATVAQAGEQKIDLSPLVFRRYDYRLRLTLDGAKTGLGRLRLAHDIQHSQRPLPALAQGDNTITFSTGPAEGTITLEGSLQPENKGKQLVAADFHPTMENVEPALWRLKGGTGQVTFPVQTPGDMTYLRFGCFYRARDARDAWELQVSFDGGKTFKTIDTAAGPAAFAAKWVEVGDIPPGTKAALIRYAGKQRNTLCAFDFRIDADYREPHGGMQPVDIVYEWEENGEGRKHSYVAVTPQETYRIHCAAKPLMKSISLQLVDTP